MVFPCSRPASRNPNVKLIKLWSGICLGHVMAMRPMISAQMLKTQVNFEEEAGSGDRSAAPRS